MFLLSFWRLILNWKIKFKFSRKLVFTVKSIGKVNSTNSTVSVDLNNCISLDLV